MSSEDYDDQLGSIRILDTSKRNKKLNTKCQVVGMISKTPCQKCPQRMYRMLNLGLILPEQIFS